MPRVSRMQPGWAESRSIRLVSLKTGTDQSTEGCMVDRSS